MHNEDFSQPMFNALPKAVIALAVLVMGVELVITVGELGILGGETAIGWRLQVIRDYAFYSPLLVWLFETGNWSLEHLKRFVTYSFVHWSFTHAIFVTMFLLALGKLVGEVFGNIAVLVIFFACGIFGAIVYAGLTGDDRPLVGGYPSVYGLIGAYTFLLWVGLGAAGENQYRAFTLIGFLLGLQLFFGLVFGTGSDWVAEVAGFALGFLLTPALAPGAFKRFMQRMRQR
ncbi:rhomboid family intramembrane serine protease [Rhodobacteraceae bacterium]|nr:rhomboid family intramembrane serine protease [Paracoccaceae bacterium]